MAVHIIVFLDTFVVNKLIKEDSFSNNVTRIEGKSLYHDMFMQLDVNTEKNPMSFGERFGMALAWTPNLDGTNDTKLGCEDRNMTTQEKMKEFLAESYDRLMCGKLYKISEEKEWNSDESAPIFSREIHASFDGLLMMLKGNHSYLPHLKLGQTLYLLIKKLGVSVTLHEYIKPQLPSESL